MLLCACIKIRELILSKPLVLIVLEVEDIVISTLIVKADIRIVLELILLSILIKRDKLDKSISLAL
jgi:hypothetical protein